MTSIDTIIAYLEYLVQNGLALHSVKNHLCVLNHFFCIYGWPIVALRSRKVALFCKSVKNNVPVSYKSKGVFTIDMIKTLMLKTRSISNAVTFRAIFLFAFYGFFRLASLVPSAVSKFDNLRFPIVQDVIWASPGIQFILKTAKNIQGASEYKIIQIPKISNPLLCPVTAIQTMLRNLSLTSTDPLFVSHPSTKTPLTAYEVRKVLKSLVCSMGLNSSEFGFHAFRRSGATYAFECNVPVENIKVHGHWKSDAVYTYLQSPQGKFQICFKTPFPSYYSYYYSWAWHFSR